MKAYFKSILFTFIIVMCIGNAMTVSGADVIENNGVKLDMPGIKEIEGHINISGSTMHEKIKLRITGADKQVWHDVKLSNGEFCEELWFDKSGEYTIQVMVNEYDRKYSYGPQITVENEETLNMYLIPGKHIESNEEIIISTARDITENCSSDLEKTRAIYDWIVNNIEYDYNKIAKHNVGNYDNEYGALNTMNTRTGVCYDYSTLLAALTRSLGIQAKVVEGDLNRGEVKSFHAWNEVFITEADAWINIDATMGATTDKDYFDFADFDETHTAYVYK